MRGTLWHSTGVSGSEGGHHFDRRVLWHWNHRHMCICPIFRPNLCGWGWIVRCKCRVRQGKCSTEQDRQCLFCLFTCRAGAGRYAQVHCWLCGRCSRPSSLWSTSQLSSSYSQLLCYSKINVSFHHHYCFIPMLTSPSLLAAMSPATPLVRWCLTLKYFVVHPPKRFLVHLLYRRRPFPLTSSRSLTTARWWWYSTESK